MAEPASPGPDFAEGVVVFPAVSEVLAGILDQKHPIFAAAIRIHQIAERCVDAPNTSEAWSLSVRLLQHAHHMKRSNSDMDGLREFAEILRGIIEPEPTMVCAAADGGVLSEAEGDVSFLVEPVSQKRICRRK